LAAIGRVLEAVTHPISLPSPPETDDLMGLSLRSFNSACSRTHWRDRVVDLAVVLEALFVRAPGDILYKAAFRAATVLGNRRRPPNVVFKSVEAFYKLRNSIVHANPGLAKTASSDVIRAWRGRTASVPEDMARRGSAASQAGSELVAAALIAFLGLYKTGRRPFDEGFLDDVDLATLSDHRRRQLRQDARV
jgi:hypothetical protein